MDYKRLVLVVVFVIGMLFVCPVEAKADAQNISIAPALQCFDEETVHAAITDIDIPEGKILLRANDSHQELEVAAEGVYLTSVHTCGIVLLLSASALIIHNRKRKCR